jgi:beta-lactamase regulating signal transducer with metallopeptidase domain
MNTTIIASWLLTYLIHSTIILAAALAVSRFMDGRNLAAQEGLLRAALVGGVLTATLQLGLGISPVGGVFALDAAATPIPAHPISAPLAAADVVVPSGSSAGQASSLNLPSALIGLWCIASFAGLIAILRSILDLRRLLHTRCLQPTGRFLEGLAAAIGLRRPVRLSTSKAIAVPFATGIRQPEICCPERVHELAREHRRGLFAHELAHLVRRDPAWQLAYRLGEALFALQPLNRPVRRRLEELAEHLADERAAASTGDRLGLARCLVVVAHWGRSSGLGLPATALAAGPRLDRRIRRLIAGTADRRSTGRWALPICVALLAGSAAVLPAVGASPAHAGQSPTSVAGTPTWSTDEDRPADAPAAVADPPAPPAPPTAAAPPEPAAAPTPEPPPAEEPRDVAPTQPAPSAAPAPASAPAPHTEPVSPIPPASAAPPTPEERAAAEHERADVARLLADVSARRAHMSDEERAAMRNQIRELEAEAQRTARETSAAERDAARALELKARALARETAVRGERLAVEQREELRRQALELRAQAELKRREAADRMREEARALAAEARRLAEQAEAERLEREHEER